MLFSSVIRPTPSGQDYFSPTVIFAADGETVLFSSVNPGSVQLVGSTVPSSQPLPTYLTGPGGVLPVLTGYIQNVGSGSYQANQDYPIPGVALPEAVIGPSPVSGSVAYADFYFPPYLNVSGYNNVVMWYEGINNASYGFYPYQLYGRNPGGANAQGWTRGGAASPIPSNLNTTVNSDVLIYWFQPPLQAVILGMNNATASTAPATIDFTGIGFYATR